MNLVIINCNEDPRKQFSSVSRKNTETEYVLINNGLGREASLAVRDIFDQLKSIGHRTQLIEHATKQHTSEVVNNVLVCAMNDDLVSYLTYIDSDVDGSFVDNGYEILENYNAVAFGTIPNLEGKTMADYTTALAVAPELVKTPILLEKHTLMPTYGLVAPWTLNLQLFKQGSKNPATFQVVANGFNQTFQPGKEVDFMPFFVHVHLGFSRLIQPNYPLVTKV